MHAHRCPGHLARVRAAQEKAIKFDMAMDKAKKSVESWRNNVGDKVRACHRVRVRVGCRVTAGARR